MIPLYIIPVSLSRHPVWYGMHLIFNSHIYTNLMKRIVTEYNHNINCLSLAYVNDMRNFSSSLPTLISMVFTHFNYPLKPWKCCKILWYIQIIYVKSRSKLQNRAWHFLNLKPESSSFLRCYSVLLTTVWRPSD